ncbi:hypothetical protein HanPI659440_Chr11g0418271 [Helianthus annuus]|nr:hypothetical protein HanPI659440_Chr11g0418271 [Helianthus annuus]
MMKAPAVISTSVLTSSRSVTGRAGQWRERTTTNKMVDSSEESRFLSGSEVCKVFTLKNREICCFLNLLVLY